MINPFKHLLDYIRMEDEQRAMAAVVSKPDPISW